MNWSSDYRFTNVVNFLHNWQNDGHQEFNLYGLEK